MNWRLLLLATCLLLMLVPGVFFIFLPEAQFRGVSEVLPPPAAPALPAERGQACLQLEAPLGMLILDCSGSMHGNDPKFRQSLAAEVFAYFFSQLIASDTAASSRDRIHFATEVYPAFTSARTRQQIYAHGDAAALLWPTDSPAAAPAEWLTLNPGDGKSVDAVATTFRDLMGTPGHDRRNGQTTPYREAIATAEHLVADYHRIYGANAAVFAVFMTDDISGGIENQLTRLPHLHLASCHLKNASEADRLIPGFLGALQLEEEDATGPFLGAGFDLASFGNRPIPVLFDASSPPRVETDNGGLLEVRGRDGIFYAVCDPHDPRIAGAHTLRVTAGKSSVTRIRVFRRPWWEFTLKPGAYDLLGDGGPPQVTLAYHGHREPANAGQPQTAAVMGPNGARVAEIPLRYDAGTRVFTARLPAPDRFVDRGNYTVQCAPEPDQTLACSFPVLRTLRLRFHQRDTGAESQRIEALPYFPMRQRP